MSELVKITEAQKALAQATEPAQIIEIEAQLEAIETYMRRAGIYSTEQIRPVNETKMRARHKLGLLLAKVERGAGPGRGKKEGGPRPSFSDYIKKMDLAETSAKEAQRIGTLPAADMESCW